MTFTVTDFFRQFPTDDACLEHLWNIRFGDEVECAKCGKVGRVLPSSQRARLFVPALRPPHSPDGRNAIRKEPHAASEVVLCHVHVYHYPPRRSGERASTPARCDL